MTLIFFFAAIVDNIGKLLSRLGIRIPHSDSKETEEKETGAKLTIEEIAEQIKNGRSVFYSSVLNTL